MILANAKKIIMNTPSEVKGTRAADANLSSAPQAAANTPPTHNKLLAETFLATLDPNADKFTFLSIHETIEGKCRKALHGTLDEYWRQVEAINTPAQGFGAFVTINATDGTGRRRRENIIRARALFADADGADQVARCREYIRTTGMIPTMVVRTSPNRAHFYWRRDIPLDMFTPLQSVLRDKLGTDNVTDLPRVMRLPGSLHLKQPVSPHLVTLRVFP